MPSIEGQISNRNDMLMSFPAMDSLRYNQQLELLRELLNENKIRMIGDLNKDEIKLITAISLIAEKKDLDIWSKGVNLYMELLLSKNRESRKEIITTIAGLNTKKNILQRIGEALRKPQNDG